MNNGEWMLTAVKVVGIPGVVAGYFMMRDWMYQSEMVRLMTIMVEKQSTHIYLLEQLIRQ